MIFNGCIMVLGGILSKIKDKFILVMTELDIKKCIYTYQNGFKVCYDLTKEELNSLFIYWTTSSFKYTMSPNIKLS